MSIVRMYSEIVADTDRNKEAWLFANDVEQLLLWHERLSQAFFDITDWLNSRECAGDCVSLVKETKRRYGVARHLSFVAVYYTQIATSVSS